MKDNKPKAKDFLLFDGIVLLIECLIYVLVLSVMTPFAMLFLQTSPFYWPVFIVLAWLMMIVCFSLTLVFIKRIFIGPIPHGMYLLSVTNDKRVLRWLIADRLSKIMERSPFYPWVIEYSFFRNIYFKLMGAKIDSTLIASRTTSIPEPWCLQAGKNVIFGVGTAITGHKVEKQTLSLGPVKIGNNVTIGAKSIIFPNVEIGDNVLVGANSIVVSGSRIPAGETWSGSPAKKVELFLSTKQ